MTVDGMTIIPSAAGDYTVEVTLNDKISLQVPVHVRKNIQSFTLVAPKWAYGSYDVLISDIVPADDVNQNLTWYWNGAIAYIGTEDRHHFNTNYDTFLYDIHWTGRAKITVTAPGGASAEV